jgi:hypothetical protein
MEKRGYTVLISHARKDSRLARKVARQIEATGASVYFDERSLEPGEPFSVQIDQALRSSDEVVTLVTSDSAHSQWMSFEVGAALGLGKRVVPIVEDPKSTELPPALLSLQSVDAGDLSRYLTELTKRVKPSDSPI